MAERHPRRHRSRPKEPSPSQTGSLISAPSKRCTGGIASGQRSSPDRNRRWRKSCRRRRLKRRSKIICATLSCWNNTGKGRSHLTNSKLRWSGWPVRPNSPECCAKSSPRWATIPWIAECLARPVLAERVITELYAHDSRFHGELKRRAEAELRTHPSVREIKQTSGMYTEMEWIKSDSTPDQNKGGSASPEDDAKANCKRRDAEDGITLNSREWDETVQKLVATFNKPDAATPKAFGVGVRSRKRGIAAFESADMSAHSKNAAADEYETLAVGKVSPLREDEGHYYAVAVTNKGKDRLKLATVAWLKEPLRSWLAKAETQVPVTMAAVSANYTLPVISGQSDNSIPSVACTDDTWTATSTTGAPAARERHTAVWTGSEMIVWGGAGSS